jgi:tetratricopeptide (TPR) repeat protein
VRSKTVTLGKIADILQARGQLDEALRIRTEEQLPVFERLGDVRSKTVTLGQIADILQARGQLDEALRIRTEEQLPVFERLGDVRSKTVTLGQIADILQARGQLDEALALHAERIPLAESLGHIDSIAHIKYSMAGIRLQRGDHEHEGLQTIYDELAEAYGIGLKLGRPDYIGGIDQLLAQVMAMGGLRDEALEVLDQAEAAYRQLGRDNGVAQIRQLREAIAQRG